MSGTVQALTLVFKCRRCHQGDVVFSWRAGASFSSEGRCSSGGCRTVHRQAVEVAEAEPVTIVLGPPPPGSGPLGRAPAVNRAVVEAVLRRSRGRCEWCATSVALELHHVDPKGMGGRRRTKEASDSPGNLLQLCRVCHGAAHHERVVLPDGHSCQRCYLKASCPHSVARPERVLRSSGHAVPWPWTPRS